MRGDQMESLALTSKGQIYTTVAWPRLLLRPAPADRPDVLGRRREHHSRRQPRHRPLVRTGSGARGRHSKVLAWAPGAPAGQEKAFVARIDRSLAENIAGPHHRNGPTRVARQVTSGDRVVVIGTVEHGRRCAASPVAQRTRPVRRRVRKWSVLERRAGRRGATDGACAGGFRVPPGCRNRRR